VEPPFLNPHKTPSLNASLYYNRRQKKRLDCKNRVVASGGVQDAEPTHLLEMGDDLVFRPTNN